MDSKDTLQPSESNAARTLRFVSHGEDDTNDLGAAIAERLEAGTIVALVGDLGSGKTRLVQSIAAALGIDRRTVTSPTFVLIQEYEGRLTLYHFDTYRLGGPGEFLDLGADEIMSSGGVCLIEWADRVASVLPADVLRIEIEIKSASCRVFRLSGSGPLSARLIERLRNGIGEQ